MYREKIAVIMVGLLIVAVLVGIVARFFKLNSATTYLLGLAISLAGAAGQMGPALIALPGLCALAVKFGRNLEFPQRPLNVMGICAICLPVLMWFQTPIMHPQQAEAAKTLELNGKALTQADTNVLLVVADTLRADAINNPDVIIPNLRKLQAQGFSAFNLSSSANQTVPSHHSLMSGLTAEQIGMRSNLSSNPQREVLIEKFSLNTLANRMHEGGRFSFGLAANPLLSLSERTDQEGLGLSEGFQHWDGLRRPDDWYQFMGWTLRHTYLGWIIRVGVHPKSAKQYASKSIRQIARRLLYPIEAKLYRYHFGEGELVTGRALAGLAELEKANRSWFMFLNYMDVHAPYLPSKDGVDPYKEFALREDLRETIADGNPDQAISQQLEALYLHELEELDAQVGKLLTAIENSKRPTLVIFTSDHGEMFGEHDQVEHGSSLFNNELQVPLIMAGPGVPKNTSHSFSCEMADLAFTIAELANISTDGLPGASILDQQADRWALSYMLGGCSLRHGMLKGIYHLDDSQSPPSAELIGFFDLSKDPAEQNDLSDEDPELLQRFTNELARRLKNDTAHLMGGRELTWNERRLLERMGYLNATDEHE